ncbi:WbqC family protein [Rhodobacter sp. KR11]|uniref:WbqC family protein n=1 Tax=Rhodobacter sp. KR11 TaxID=2974588 RepID=UPI0022225CF7|nr:WbqC family protein [Rhodobacter sp. KR11]MCW1920307.1 WbqC family protein [Rhodobacter sp. KR11]
MAIKTAVMQPYFLPYLGYFQLIAAVDRFVIYDRIKYTKKGWINRNQMLLNGRAAMFTLPLAKGSDDLDICDRALAGDFDPAKLAAQIAGAYRRAPEFAPTMALIEAILHRPSVNLFDFIAHSIRAVCGHLGITTPILVASEVEGASSLTHVDRVIDLCLKTGAEVYVNPPGGRVLYNADQFRPHGLTLKFLDPRLDPYPQFGAPFVPYLSILDILMFNPQDQVRMMLGAYDLAD